MVKTNDELIPVEDIDWGIEELSSSTLQLEKDMKLSPQESFVLWILNSYEGENEDWKGRKADPESLIKEIIEDSDKIMSQNARGDVIPDYKSRAQLKLELLKAAWVVKKNTPEVRINFLNLLFGNKNWL